MHNQDPILKAIPFIKEELNYEVKDGIVFVKFVQEHKIQKLFRKLGKKIPKESVVELDSYSSLVFTNINGKNNIGQIIKNVQNNSEEEIEHLTERTLVFLEYLLHTSKWIYYKNEEGLK